MAAETFQSDGKRFVILPLLSHAAVFNAYDLDRGPRLTPERIIWVIRTHLLAFDAVLITPGALVVSSNDVHDAVLLALLSNHKFNDLVDAGFVGTFHDGTGYDLFGAYLDEFRKLGGRKDPRRVPVASDVLGSESAFPQDRS